MTTLLLPAAQTAALEFAALVCCGRSLRGCGEPVRPCAAAFVLLSLGCFVQYAYALTHTCSTGTLAILAALTCASVSAASDLVTGYIFDAVTLPTIAFILCCSAAGHSAGACIAGMAAAGGALLLIYVVTQARGIGLGDVKLACCIGGALGAYGALAALWVAFVAGGLCAAVLLATRRRNRGDALRFGPYLAAGMAAAAFHGGF